MFIVIMMKVFTTMMVMMMIAMMMIMVDRYDDGHSGCSLKYWSYSYLINIDSIFLYFIAEDKLRAT